MISGRFPSRFAMLVAVALLGGWSAPAYADRIQTDGAILPRSFQGARLGMTQSDLMAITPDAGRVSLGANGRAQRTIVVPSKDRHLYRVKYRFHHGLLRELAICYKRDRVPQGYDGLLARLKESYGTPAAENVEAYDTMPDVLSVKKTVWKDQATTSVLTESRKMREGQEVYDLTLTITDNALQQAYEQEQAQRRRQRELSIPIPLPDKEPGIGRTVGPHSEETPDRAAG